MYGFMKYLEAEGLSQTTLDSYERRISTFIAFLNERYKEKIEPFQIKSQDIKDYINQRRESGIKDSTLEKDFGAIKRFFDYLWHTDQIPVDFVVKMKFDFKIKKKSIHLLYDDLLEVYPSICKNSTLKSRAKVLFILSMKGFRLKEIRFLSIHNISDAEGSITVSVKRDKISSFSITFNDPMEMQPLRDCICEAQSKGTNYLLFSKKHEKGSYEELKRSSVLNLWTSIEVAAKLENLNNTSIRYAHIYYLSRHQKKSIEEIASLMGTTLATTSDLLNDAILRIDQTNSDFLYKQEEEKKHAIIVRKP